ncbi:hypothetical protein GCM10023084_49430 [Streptomyces lacrimifluminis]|uniref:Anti-sigma factor antagonist n=1 Tax=Streptomyces lacrimifluminis TaxID=1500077 RepID=A0A917L798_9ACTN|nr:STAS domain-containing protein [Streptomyces lacrimifluminis]GGJ49441.1 hypothetical protein GCM10012282_52830 [Streptomyces lacrimifluminis]
MTDNQVTGPSGRLRITHTTAKGIRLVSLHGEIDHHVRDALSQALLPAATAEHEGSHRIVADLSGVTFLDSSGINVFLQVHERADAAQGWLRLAAVQAPVMRVLHLVGLDTVLACHSTVEQALDA